MDPLWVSPGLTLPAEELELRTLRSGGPGGQNVNKVETAVDLRFDVRASAALSEAQRARLLERLAPRLVGEGVLQVRASEHRGQRRNLEAARTRLATLLREGLRQERKRRATRPTLGSQRRRLDAKRRRSDTKKMRRKRGDE